MTYKSILVHLDSSRACGRRVDSAIGLARDFDAQLTGLFLTAEVTLPSYAVGGLPVEVVRMQQKQMQDRAEVAVAKFRTACDKGGVAHEARIARCHDVDVADEISMHLRYADLAVLGQSDPEDPNSTPRTVIEDVLLGAGRPAVVVPYIGASGPLGKRVMLAWDAGREAARAVADAMPMLVRADKVTVLVADARSSARGHGEQPGADIARHLARHGVKAEVHQSVTGDLSVGDAILSRLADDGCDLLVMGAYGHARLRELVLGGATRSLLEHMTVPVFMSH